MEGVWIALIYNACQFPWCNYFHLGWLGRDVHIENGYIISQCELALVPHSTLPLYRSEKIVHFSRQNSFLQIFTVVPIPPPVQLILRG